MGQDIRHVEEDDVVRCGICAHLFVERGRLRGADATGQRRGPPDDVLVGMRLGERQVGRCLVGIAFRAEETSDGIRDRRAGRDGEVGKLAAHHVKRVQAPGHVIDETGHIFRTVSRPEIIAPSGAIPFACPVDFRRVDRIGRVLVLKALAEVRRIGMRLGKTVEILGDIPADGTVHEHHAQVRGGQAVFPGNIVKQRHGMPVHDQPLGIDPCGHQQVDEKERAFHRGCVSD